MMTQEKLNELRAEEKRLWDAYILASQPANQLCVEWDRVKKAREEAEMALRIQAEVGIQPIRILQ